MSLNVMNDDKVGFHLIFKFKIKCLNKLQIAYKWINRPWAA